MKKLLILGGLAFALSLVYGYLAKPSKPAKAQKAIEATASPATAGKQGKLLSAFFGLDNALPFGANLLCRGAADKDGMPVVLSNTIEGETLEPQDFKVITSAGIERTPSCVTLRPASDEGELRTVLMIGEFGDAEFDPPARVLVVDDLLSDGATGEQVNFRGAEISVIPLADGPTLVWADIVPPALWSQTDGDSACPANTEQVVRVTWAGGVRLPNGDELGDAERALYRVSVMHTDGSTEEVSPIKLSDLGDRDNNHLLCLKTSAPARTVTFPAGHLVDPNGDLNPDSGISIDSLVGHPSGTSRKESYNAVISENIANG